MPVTTADWKRIGLTAIGVAITCTIAHRSVFAAESSKSEVSANSLPQVLSLIRPQENEWRHLNVNWLTDVVAARKRAAAEDKPIIICYTGGAGYNEPLGVC